MSQFGVMLLMFALVIGMVGLIKFLAWLTDLQEQGGVGAAIKRGAARYIDRRESVRGLPAQTTPVKPSPVMSMPPQPPGATGAELVRTTSDLIRVAARLTERERIIVLASMRDADGSPYSANKIVAFLGGNRGDILAVVREFRPAEESPASYTTPIAGRPTAAQFETDPELAYRPPPS